MSWFWMETTMSLFLGLGLSLISERREQYQRRVEGRG
ncbi:hypothetical protein GLYMA_04G226851v4 [Glycine max]|nr:hypothetical protein GLYMA_04G226851v4 [Glycine max]